MDDLFDSTTSGFLRLWARSRVQRRKALIYFSILLQDDGCCYVKDKGPAQILLRADLIRRPKLLEETLIHEACHMVEFIFLHNAVTPFGGKQYGENKQCSRAVQILGLGVSEFMQNLKLVKGAVKPSSKARFSFMSSYFS